MNDFLTNVALWIYGITLPISWLALAICVLVLSPMALFKKTRKKAGGGMVLASYLFGITTWTLGAAVTFSTFGWLGLIIGLALFGVGVVPIAIIAAFFVVGEPSLGVSLIVMTVLIFASRIIGAMLVEAGE